jgi:hypothetical protein
MNNKTVLAALACACFATLAPAAPPAPATQASSFICGGVSQPDAEAMKAQARDHDLMLTFADASGAYVADVDVQISDRRGHVVLKGTCDGPIMLVDLPGSGSWRVTAQTNGITKQQSIATTRGRTARATFVWPADQ